MQQHEIQRPARQHTGQRTQALTLGAPLCLAVRAGQLEQGLASLLRAGGMHHTGQLAEACLRDGQGRSHLYLIGDVGPTNQHRRAERLDGLDTADTGRDRIVCGVVFQPGRPVLTRWQAITTDQHEAHPGTPGKMGGDLQPDAAQTASDQIGCTVTQHG